MNEKYLKHTVENLIEFVNDLTFIDTTKNNYVQAINALKTAESLIDFYKNELYELEGEIADLKVKVGKMLFDEMVNDCRETVEDLTGLVF
ncbi:hypothetical protein HMPREF1215_00709 [Coprococcus sp. HPP0074]|jgi:hypothetical protein|nr:hypothetical protein HMPREF1215_00709 [Coprococcus sp. HPP0074]